MTELNLKDVKTSKLVELLFEIYRSIFLTNGSEEEALFAKALIDFNRRILISSLELGINEKTVPILNISLWQSILSGDVGVFKIRIESAGGNKDMTDSLAILITEIQEAINKWGDKSFGGIMTIDDKKINPEGVSWVVGNKDEKK